MEQEIQSLTTLAKITVTFYLRCPSPRQGSVVEGEGRPSSVLGFLALESYC